MTEPRRFDIRELAGASDADGDAELGAALAAARRLESTLAGAEPRPSPDLGDRIMAAIAREPAPRLSGIMAALRRRPGPGGLRDSLRVAWSRGLGGGASLGLRVGGLAYVAAVLVLMASIVGVAGYVTVGALGGFDLFGPPASEGPTVTALPTPALSTPAPLVSPGPSESQSPESSESPAANQTPEPSDDRGGGGPAVEPSDDHGEDAGESAQPEPSDDGEADGVSGSGSSSQSPDPSRTPRPSETPKPTSTDG